MRSRAWRVAWALAAAPLLLAAAGSAQTLALPGSETTEEALETPNCFCGAEQGTGEPFCFQNAACSAAADCRTSADCGAGEVCLSFDNFCFAPKCAVQCGDCTNPGGAATGFEVCEEPVPAMGRGSLIALAAILALLAVAILSRRPTARGPGFSG